MKLYENAIQTDRAFIYFNKIAHISWKKRIEDYEVKIYSEAGVILQNMSEREYNSFLEAYKKITHDLAKIDGF